MTVNLSREEARAILSKPKRAKYGNTKCEYKGIKFDSKRERAYYIELEQREKAGEVVGIELQRPFAILINGFLIGNFKSDFAFWDCSEDRFRVIDVKGMDTPLSKFKRKCVKAQYGFTVEIVR
jgi:hypothetical protein